MDQAEKPRKKTFVEILWGTPDDYVPPRVDNERINKIMAGGFLFGFTASDLLVLVAATLTIVVFQLEPYIIPFLEGLGQTKINTQVYQEESPRETLPAAQEVSSPSAVTEKQETGTASASQTGTPAALPKP